MKHWIFAAAALASVIAMPAFAQAPYDGQRPAPSWLAAQTALPDCGFAATETWGGNGFQYCDARNVHGSSGRW